MATNGTPNACSCLLGAAWRAARAIGYRRLVTYTRADERGASLRAAGLRVVAELPPSRGWSCRRRPRTDRYANHGTRLRWELTATPPGQHQRQQR